MIWGDTMRKAGEWLRTSGSATTAATCPWECSGGCWYESTIFLSRCAHIAFTGGVIAEGILSGVCIVGSTDHAMRQSSYVLKIGR
jgi:hypothetical protein